MNTHPNPSKIFQITQVIPQTFVGLISCGPGMQNHWSSVAHYYNELLPHHHDVRTIIQHNDTFVHEDILLDPLYRFQEGPQKSDLSSALKCLFNLMKHGRVNNNLQILIISEGSITKEVEENIMAQMQEYQEVMENFSVNLHIFAIGENFQNSTLQILKDLFNQKNSKNLISQIQVTFQSSKYSEILKKKFIKIKQLFNQNNLILNYPLPEFPWSQSKKLSYIKNNYFVTSSEYETIDGSIRGESVCISALNELLFCDILAIHEDWLNIVHFQQKSKNTDLCGIVRSVIQELKAIEEQVMTLLPEELKILKQLRAQILKLDLNAFNDHFTDRPEQLRKDFQVKKIKDINILKKYGVSLADFDLYVSEFTDTLKDAKIDFDSSDQDKSMLSLANMKDILCDSDYLDILEQARDAYQISLYFPIVGQGVHINHSTSDISNIWDVNIVSFPKVHQTFDTSSIYSHPAKRICIELQDGYLQEIITSVIPLFSEKDQDLQPFLQSKFFDTLMTFNLLHTADVCYTEAHAALLAHYLIYLISLQDTEWQRQQLALVYNTFKLKYSDNVSFNTIKGFLLGNSVQHAFIDQDDKKQTNHEAKILLIIFVLSIENPKELSTNLIKIFTYMLINKKGQSKIISDYLQFDISEIQSDLSLVSSIQEQLKPQSSYRELQVAVEQVVKDFDFVDFLQKKGKTIVENIKAQQASSWYKFFAKEDIPRSVIHCASFHYCNGSNPITTILSPLQGYDVIQKEVLANQMLESGDTARLIRRIIQNNMKQLESCQQPLLTPISESNLNLLCSQHNIKRQKFIYDSDTNMVRNACMSQECIYYLKPQLTNIPFCWCSYFYKKAAMFTTIKENSDLSSKKIYDICFMKTIMSWGGGKRSQKMLQIIEHLKSVYEVIDS